MSTQNPFLNLGSAFQNQQQQAGLAQLLNDEQFKQIQALNDPTTNLALAKQTADAQAAYPTLKTDVNAVGMGEGILKGLSNAINNGQQIGRYNQQVQAYQGIQNAYQQAQAQQRELTMGQIAADQARRQRAGGLLPQEVQGIYGALDPTGQNALLTKEVGRAYTPLEGTAEGQAQVNKGKVINEARAQMPPVEIGGVPQAAQIDAARNIQGFAPTTSLDVNKQYMDNQKAANELRYQPGKLRDEATERAYDLRIKEVDAQFAQQEKELSIKRDQLANLKGTADYDKAMAEYKRFNDGQKLFKLLQDRGDLRNTDPQKQSEIQAQLGIYGIKYDPPNTPYRTTKDKTGAVWQVDNATGLVRPLIDKNGKVAYGEWHQKTP